MSNNTHKRPRSSWRVRVPESYPWLVRSAFVNCLPMTQIEKEQAIRIATEEQLSDYESDRDLQSMIRRIPWDGLNNSLRVYQVGALLRKFKFSANDKTCTDNAVRKFSEAEDVCKSVNASTNYGRSKDWLEKPLIAYMRSWIIDTIGIDVPHPTELEGFRHGPGASVGIGKGQTDSYFKYDSLPYACPSHALGLARLVILQDERWCRAICTRLGFEKHDEKSWFWTLQRHWKDKHDSRFLEPCDTNRITFVPKNRSTHRTIAIEPMLGSYLQLGYDTYLRQCLLSRGVNLYDQTINQRFACEGSISGKFSTVDLSAASDTVSLGICRMLLPEAWFSLALRLRSRFGALSVEGSPRTIQYEKISSMGNALTFSIESLIFAAATAAVMKAKGIRPRASINFHVYGDDIVCPSIVTKDLLLLLGELGFSSNEDKTFSSGPIRESCGKEYHNGTEIQPVYLRKYPTYAFELFSDYNRLRSRVLMLGGDPSSLYSLFSKWFPRGSPVGPYEEENMWAWIHHSEPPVPPDVHGSFRHERLVVRRRRLKRHFHPDFVLMKASLKPCHVSQCFNTLDMILSNDGGSVFTISRRDDLIVAKKHTSSFKWEAGPAGD